MARSIRYYLLAGAFLASARPSPAQQPDSVTIVAGIRYKAGGPLGWLTRWIFGARHRDLWGTPVRVEAIEPERWRGGIRLLGADTGLRIGYLYYRDSVGETWTFRAIDRDLTALVPERFRRAAMSGFFQDLYSARHPGAPLVWPTLARAAGVGVTSERMVAMMSGAEPTPGFLEHGVDTRFRQELDDPGVAIPTSALLDALASPGAPGVDTLAYLRERLFDLFVGSWDPLPQEWLWAPRGGRYTPLPRDRDGAFSRFDGLVASLAATGWAELAEFGEDYTGKLPVTARTRVLDRHLLTGLDPERWIPIALELRARLTDSVIDAAVDHLPPEYRSRSGAELAEKLRSRRDGLPEAAQRFRLLVVEDADVYGTTGPDSVTVDFAVDSVMRVRVAGRFDQTFHAAETNLVRLYLRGGDDFVLTRGSGVLAPMLHVAVLDGSRILDSSLARRFQLSRELPPQLVDAAEAPLIRGGRLNAIPWLGFNSDLGVLVGGGVVHTSYDPDWDPWRRRMRLRLGYASEPSVFGLEFRGEFRFRSSPAMFRVEAKASGLEILKFYGYGNETERTEAKDFYRTDQQHLVLAPSLVLPLDGHLTAEFGPVVKRVTTGLDQDNLISLEPLYGVSETGFAQLGAQGTLLFDTRDSRLAPSQGVLLRLGTTAYPALLDAAEAFGSFEASAAAAVTPWRPLTLAGRVSSRTTWGRYPAHEAAYLGGSRTVRSLSSQRFAGDAAVWGNFDSRLRLTTLPMVMRWDFGVLGVADLGRVFYGPEQSSTWHYGLGGGVWAALPDRSFMGLVNVVAGDDGVKFWAGSSFIF